MSIPATLFFSYLPSISGGRERFTSSLLGFYPASIITHRLMAGVLPEDTVLGLMLSSCVLSFLVLCFARELSFTENPETSVANLVQRKIYDFCLVKS